MRILTPIALDVRQVLAEVHLRARIGDAPGPVQSLGQHCFRLVEFALKVIEHAEVVHRAQVRCIVAELQPALPRALEVDRCVGEQAHQSDPSTAVDEPDSRRSKTRPELARSVAVGCGDRAGRAAIDAQPFDILHRGSRCSGGATGPPEP